jgi:hypothetical protein
MANELTNRAQPISAAQSMQSNVAPARECAGIPDSEELRKRASWYREIAERTGNPTIWAMRLRTAEKLEAEADHLEYLNSFPSDTEVGERRDPRP